MPDVEQARNPVTAIPEDANKEPQDGVGLCLSGGGYRAMLFHTGSLWRLNEAGILPKLDRISSVSGGSIIAGMLGLAWKNLRFNDKGIATQFASVVVTPIRGLAGKTIDAGAIIGGILLPGAVSDKVSNAYRKHLYGNASLQDLPEKPRFVINATNVQSGALWRFTRPYLRDYLVGEIKNPKIELAIAVAASSAFPPVLSPLKLELEERDFTPGNEPLHRPPYTTDVYLTDGGVYDNLGLETVWKRYKTVLVSDGGGKMEPEAEPETDWARHALRINELIDNQVRSLRKRQVIDSFKAKDRTGTYWGIRTNVADYQLEKTLDCPHEKTMRLARTATRLQRLDAETQERIINWGYAVCDAAIRKHFDPQIPLGNFPYPAAGVG